ncbi:gas vesicle protein GvpM [Natrinema salifodinae]|uniref:Gas vesicle protein n=1 Tax=Natrinema salifodinae TaxID=1202768 RepID=A0A1I0MAC5_9EURY|nr:gas vesicle protein [Natrinema salifodinae]SEV84914.1 Gas vesicle protein [Natrinema salifodinae]
MRPQKDDEAFVDVLDVLLRDGAVLRADVIVSVADIPLVGIKLTAAIAGMETMNEYGLFEEWDGSRRRAAVRRRQYRRPNKPDAETELESEPAGEPGTLDELGVGTAHEGVDDRDDADGAPD